MKLNRCYISLFILAGSWCQGATPATHAATWSAAYGKLPLIFERNQGQADPAIRFLARGRRYAAALVDDGVQLRIKGMADSAVHVQFTGKNSGARFDTPDKLPGISNYLMGNDPRLWIQRIPQYGKVWQRNVYPGIDVAYYGSQGELEYDFVMQPGADPGLVRMHITGAGRLRVDADGDLILGSNGLKQKLPVAWQERDGKRRLVSARYRLLADDMVGLSVSDYDRGQTLVIDPVLALAFSTYLGGTATDQANGIAVDATGNTWIAGSSTSIDFPVTGAPKPTNAGGSDAFVAKLDPTGATLLFSTYLGGGANDQANAIAVDTGGNAYIAGSTLSVNFPFLSPVQNANAGGMDGFAAKLNSTGGLVYSTYLGGTQDDSATGIAVDINGLAYVAGYTSSGNFPTASPQQVANHGGKDAFMLKLNATGNTLLYSTYLGGTLDDQANGIAVDPSGNAYVTGNTASANFPISAAYQTTPAGAFVVKLSSGGLVVYSTYLGGGGSDVANAIAVDSTGEAFVAGSTSSPTFPVKNAFQATWADANNLLGNAPDAFLTKFNSAGNGLVYSTYFGGATTSVFTIMNTHRGGADVAYGVAVDANGNAYLTGSTTQLGSVSGTIGNFPLLDPLLGYTGPQPQGELGPWYHTDGFLASFGPTGSLIYSTEIGGLLDDVATAVAVDANGAAYITGYTKSTDFPVQTPLQGNNAAVCGISTGCGTSNAFISKLTFSTPGVRVFFASAVPSVNNVNVQVPIVISGTGCSLGAYNAGTTVDTTLGTPVVFQAGSTCTVNVLTSPAAGGVRYAFASWSDGNNTNPRSILAPSHGTTYTINVAPQYLLTTAASPAFAGSIVASPTSPDGYYAAGTSVALTAVPNAGFLFSNFSGDVVGITNGQSVVMSAPRSVTASFVPSAAPQVAIDNPTPGAAISGSVTVSGWALDNAVAGGTQINSVQVKVDGVVVGNASYGSPRPDVCTTFPGRAGCPNVGYTFTLNANNLVPGAHTITVTATDSDASPDSGSASVNITSTLTMTGDKAGVFRNGISFLEDTNGNGLYDAGVDKFIPSFVPPGGQQPGDVPVSGDWTGDGHTKVGLYRPSAGTWWLDANNDGVFNTGDYTYQFGGVPGDLPVVGDWNAVPGVSVNKSCIGIYRAQGSVWLLDLNCNGTFENTPTDAFFPFGGLAGDVPVVGKWTGTQTRVGVVRKYAPGGVPQGNAFFWVPDGGAANAGNFPADHPSGSNTFGFGGLAGDVFVTGDWYNTGTSYAGVYRAGLWVLDAAPPSAAQTAHVPGFTFGYGGIASDVPVTGKW